MIEIRKGMGGMKKHYFTNIFFPNGIREVPMVGLIHLNFKCKMGIWQIPIRLNALMTTTRNISKFR